MASAAARRGFVGGQERLDASLTDAAKEAWHVRLDAKLAACGIGRRDFNRIRKELGKIDGIGIVEFELRMDRPELFVLRMAELSKADLAKVDAIMPGVGYRIHTPQMLLEEVRLRRGTYLELDDNMRELVRTLNLRGFPTISCREGMLEDYEGAGKVYTEPFVAFKGLPEWKRDELGRLAATFNQITSEDRQWFVTQSGGMTRLAMDPTFIPKTGEELKLVHDDVKALGRLAETFIFRGDIRRR